MYSASEKHILDIKGVDFSYEKEKPFIEDISLSVDNSEFIGLLGANGSGKSTLLKLASGIHRPSRGTVNLWGKEIFTVREFVGMGMYPYDTLPELTVDDAIEMVGLSGYAESLTTNLSGGERRRVYIAMTLLQGAGLVLLDEPLANLDIKYQIELLKLLKDLREKRDITLIMALHDINIAFQFDRIVIIKEGRILGSGSPGEVLTTEFLKEAFDVEVEIKREDSGGAYIKF
jgi:iron complex transport system ATP-binding protein